MKMKPIGALLGAGMLALTLAGTASAQDGHPTPISDTSPSVSVDCTGGPGGADITPGAGQVAWVFVHTKPDSQSGVLTAVYTKAGTQHADSYIQGGVKYLITTDGPDTITAFSDTISGGELVLSHVCYGATTTTTTTSSTTSSETTGTTSSTTTETSTTSSETTGSSTTSSTTSSETTGSTTTDGTTTTTTTDGTTTTSAETTGTTTTTNGTTTTSTPSGSVLGETGSPTVTPPATDAVSSSSRTPSGAWNLVLTLGIVLTLSILVLTPMAKARRK